MPYKEAYLVQENYARRSSLKFRFHIMTSIHQFLIALDPILTQIFFLSFFSYQILLTSYKIFLIPVPTMLLNFASAMKPGYSSPSTLFFKAICKILALTLLPQHITKMKQLHNVSQCLCSQISIGTICYTIYFQPKPFSFSKFRI